MVAATLTSKGQVTIPKPIRDALALEAGHRLLFELRDDGVVEVQAETRDLLSLEGVLEPRVRGVTLEDMQQAIEEGALPR